MKSRNSRFKRRGLLFIMYASLVLLVPIWIENLMDGSTTGISAVRVGIACLCGVIALWLQEMTPSRTETDKEKC